MIERSECLGVLRGSGEGGLNRQRGAASGPFRARHGRVTGEVRGMGESTGRCGGGRGISSCAWQLRQGGVESGRERPQVVFGQKTSDDGRGGYGSLIIHP